MDTDGIDASCVTWGRLCALAAASLVCIDVWDKAGVSDVGVDDHAIKFPGTDEPSVWSWVVSCRVEAM